VKSPQQNNAAHAQPAASRAPVQWPHVRASVLQPLLAPLREAGHLPRALGRQGLRESDLADPYNFVSLARYVALYEHASFLLKDPQLGVRLGTQTKLAELLGPVGMMFLMARSLQGAIEVLARFLNIWQSHTNMGVLRGAQKSEIVYQISESSIWPRRQDAEFSISALVTFVRDVLGRPWRPDEIHLEHGAPADAEAVQAAFGVPIRFGQSINRIIFSTPILDRVLPASAQAMAPFLERHLLDLARTGPTANDTVAGQAGFVVASRLGSGSVALGRVAREMGLSPRTLQRRLEQERVTFRDIVRLQRQRVAEGLIVSGRVPCGQVAEMLGYAESTVLSRAFKSWTGATPRDFARAKRKAGEEKEVVLF
jgi:AraC-like DNA-binding protein